jgi:glycosyltransferase involved in cell wall biosynthesis
MSDASQFRADLPTPASAARPTSRFSLADPEAQPVVSIVTPFFNAGAAFDETATSVFRQTFRQWEWIVVNDGTTDPDSLAVLDSYRSVDLRIRVVDLKENGGPGAARNRGFAEASGRYVMQLDNDDLLEPTAIEKLFWFLETHREFAFAKGYTVGFGAESYVWGNGFHVGDAFLEQNHADVLTMIHRDVAIDVGGYDESNRSGLEDWHFWLKLAAAGYWGGTVHEPLGWYRRRGSHTDTWSNWDGGPREQQFRDRLRGEFPELWNGGFPAPSDEDTVVDPQPRHGLDTINRLSNPGRSVLMIVPWLEVGGADRVNLQIIDALVTREWDVTVVTTLPSRNAWESEFVLRTPDVFVMDRFLDLADRPAFLDYLIESRDPSVVLVSNSWFGYDLTPFLRAKHPKVAFVDLTHAEEEWNDGGFPNLSNQFREFLDLRITGSDHVRNWMLERAGEGDIDVWYTGVDSSRFKPTESNSSIRSDIGVSEGGFVVLFVGRMSKEKQPQVVIRVTDQLVQKGFDVVGVLVGDGPEFESLEAEVSARSLERRVVFERSVSDARVAGLMAAADVFLLPSVREGIAVTVYEAMASGLPVIASDVGGQSELVTPETGILISDPASHDVVARLESNIEGLIADPSRRQAMGVAARERVESEFSADDADRRFHELLLKAIASVGSLSKHVPSDHGTDLDAVIDRHRAIETQQRYTLDQWKVQRREIGQPVVESPAGSSQAAYGKLMRVLGHPYRRLKAKNPRKALALRDWVRSRLGYRR